MGTETSNARTPPYFRLFRVTKFGLLQENHINVLSSRID